MAKQTINIGTGELSGDGESLRSAFQKTNDNFDELYSIKADISSVPTKLSDLPNDIGFVTVANITDGTLTIDVNNTGDLIGSVFGEDSTQLIDSTESKINLDGTVKGNIIPSEDSVYNLGSPDKKFKSLYVSANTIFIGDASISVEEGKLQFTEQGGTPVEAATIEYVDAQISQAVIDASGVDLFGYVQNNDNVSLLTNDANYANQAYVDQAETDAIATANAYTDTRESSIISAYQAYADQAETDAVLSARSYTDTRETAITSAYQSYADTAEADAISTANAYTDTRETAITSAYQSYADTAEADAISAAASDATAKADAAESAANAYTDTRETAITSAYQSYADTAEADAISAANAYTDSREGTIEGAYQAYADQAEADAISTANAYTDTRETAITSAYQSYADTAEADAISTAASDATAKANTAQANAQTYTDTREAVITSAYQAYADQAETDAIASAKSYTDGREILIIGAYQSYADTAEADARNYADGIVTVAVAALQGQITQSEDDAISAAQTYTDAQINSLVGTSPATLDTIEEIAQALGNDPNAVSSITSALANRVRTDTDEQQLSLGSQLNARTNIGLGTASTQDATDFATAAQGALADTALQPGDDLSDLNNDLGFLTSVAYSDITGKPNTLSGFGILDAATSAQGALADSAVQPGDLISTLTNDEGFISSVSFDDLTSTPTTLAGYGITNAATFAQGLLADSAIQPGDNISELTNDAGYVSSVSFGDLTGKPTTLGGYGISDAIYASSNIAAQPIRQYYDNQGDFPSASTWHGAIAHSHADNSMYFAHGGIWNRLANATELFDKQFGSLENTPTTLSGYGITDAVSASSISVFGASLIDDLDPADARGTLGLGSAAVTNVEEYATAEQGATADTALQPTDNISELTNDVGYLTGTTGVEPGDNVSDLVNDAGYLTSVAFGDLTSTPTTISGYGITDALQAGDNVSVLVNDAGYLTGADVSDFVDQAFVTSAVNTANAYTDNAISTLIDSAPGALDTLNELAFALGDDPNFAASIASNLAGKFNTADFDSTFDTRLALKTTDDLTEGATNLYYTQERVRNAISAIGDISYDSTTGVISFNNNTGYLTLVTFSDISTDDVLTSVETWPTENVDSFLVTPGIIENRINAETLDTITARGNTTTNNIDVGNVTAATVSTDSIGPETPAGPINFNNTELQNVVLDFGSYSGAA